MSSTAALADLLRAAENVLTGSSGNRGAGDKDAATGPVDRDLPMEFREGLDRYFNDLEKQRR